MRKKGNERENKKTEDGEGEKEGEKIFSLLVITLQVLSSHSLFFQQFLPLGYKRRERERKVPKERGEKITLWRKLRHQVEGEERKEEREGE